nr:ionotropic receptor 75a [Fopius arisanus]
MGLWTVLLSSVIVSQCVQSDPILEYFIRDYFNTENIHHINVFGCWDDMRALEFSRNVMNLDNAVSYNPISSQLNLPGILKVNYYYVGVVLDYDCPMSDFLINKFSTELRFNESYFWLLLTNSSSPPENLLRKLPLTVESELTVATLRDDKFELWDAYNPSYSHGGVLNITYKGSWDVQNGLKNELTQYKYERRCNFHLLPLNWSTVLRERSNTDLQTYLETPVSRHLDTMSRYHYALVMQLRDLFNFSINLQVYHTWGYLINGSFGGLLGALIEGQTDASVSSFQYKPERMDVVDYLVETMNVQLRFFFRHPRSNDLQNNFLKPFAIHLWWLIIAVGFFYWIILTALKKLEIIYENVEINENTISATALTTIAAITQQGLSTAPVITSGRVVFLSLFLWTLLLFQFYSASIVGSLLAPPSRWITTLDNLTDSNIECIIEDMPYMVDYFATTANPHSKAMFQRKIRPTNKKPKGSYMPAAEGLQRVREGGVAFHINVATGYKMIEDTFEENEICELQEIDMVGQCLTSMVTPKKSPFNEMFTWG